MSIVDAKTKPNQNKTKQYKMQMLVMWPLGYWVFAFNMAYN